MKPDTGAALGNIVSHAYSETDYYRQLFDERGIDASGIAAQCDLAQIPFLARDELQKDEGRFLAKRYQKFPLNETLELRRAIGPAGHIMKVYWDRNDDERSKAQLRSLRKSRYGISPDDRVCSFHSAVYMGNKLMPHEGSIVSRDGKQLSFSVMGLTDERLKSCLVEMADFGANWLSLRPSIALLLAEAIERHNLPIPPTLRYVELTGELLLDEHRRIIQGVFQVELAFLCSSGETNPIAFECKHKSLHVLDDDVAVEIVKGGLPVIGEVGGIHVTSLRNHAMPLIRFETGDIGLLLDTVCRCGEKTPTLKLVDSHPCEFFVSEAGQRISGASMESIIEHTNESMSRAIRKFRITQKAPGEFDVELALKPAYVNWQESVKQEFLANVSEPGLKLAKWDFVYAEGSRNMRG